MFLSLFTIRTFCFQQKQKKIPVVGVQKADKEGRVGETLLWHNLKPISGW